MKKLFSMMALFTALVMSVSCTKDGEFSNDDLVGAWECIKEHHTGSVDGQIVDDDTYYYDSGEHIIDFGNNGTFEIFDEGEYAIDGKYSVNGSELVLRYDEDSDKYKILSLTPSELVIEAEYSYTEDGVRYSEKVTSYFRKAGAADDDDAVIEETSIVGTWEAVEEYVKEVEDGEVYEDSYEYDAGEYMWIFKKNGTMEMVEYGESYGEIISYKVNGSKLVMTYEGESVSINIKKLDSRELVLTQSYSETGYSYYTEIVFRKR